MTQNTNSNTVSRGKILVTGGAGLVGKELISQLLAKGERSIRFDSEMIDTFYHTRDTLSKKISYHFKLFINRRILLTT